MSKKEGCFRCNSCNRIIDVTLKEISIEREREGKWIDSLKEKWEKMIWRYGTIIYHENVFDQRGIEEKS